MAAAWATYVAVSVLSLLSLVACTRLSAKARLRGHDSRRLLALLVAISAGVMVLFSPLDELSDRFFSAHMIEHELLLFTMPIALLAARPLPIAVVAPWRLVPSSWRRSAGKGWNWGRSSLANLSYFERPCPAFILSAVTLWLWHVPPLYDLALKSDTAHTLEHLLFLVSALLYWRPLLDSRHSNALTSNAKRAAYLLAGGMQGGLLGALIALNQHVFYAGYLTQPASLASVLADQQLGGVIMWFSGPVFYVVLTPIVMNGDRLTEHLRHYDSNS